MTAELLAAALIGLLAVGVLLAPLIWPSRRAAGSPDAAYVDFEETARGQALLAIKEIEFDRVTGKLSESDYDELKETYTARAVALLEAEATAPDGTTSSPAQPSCPTCGPRPEADALVCSTCGQHLPAVLACGTCGNRLPAASRFCDQCGGAVAA